LYFPFLQSASKVVTVYNYQTARLSRINLLLGVTDVFCCLLQQHRTGLAAKIWQHESKDDVEKWISERKRFVIGCYRLYNINSLFNLTACLSESNNIQDNVYGAVIMAEPLQEFTRFI